MQTDLPQRRFCALSLSWWLQKSLARHFVVDFLGAETLMLFAEWPAGALSENCDFVLSEIRAAFVAQTNRRAAATPAALKSWH